MSQTLIIRTRKLTTHFESEYAAAMRRGHSPNYTCAEYVARRYAMIENREEAKKVAKRVAKGAW